MRTKTTLIITPLLAAGAFHAALLSPQAPAIAAMLIYAAGRPGLVVVNESSGSITFCFSAVFSSGVPFGKCAGIGGLPKASLSGNAFVTISSLAAFAGNLATGFVVECALTWNANTGQPTGSCVPVANPIP